ncbi:MAG: hypothetical protein IJ061_07550, partial [Lachnospiraceae bacterium]|nr:hypothetical protein [Lachnospiraceae bacterium]
MKNLLGIWRKAVAVTISILLVTSSVNVPGLVLGVQAAQEKLVKKTVVTAFEMLEEEISEQSVSPGASRKDIIFPESVRIQGKVVTLSEAEEYDPDEVLSGNEDAGWQTATPSDLTDVEAGGAWKTARVSRWEVDPNESTSGKFRAENIGDIFSFIPVLSDKYIVDEELELPVIRVTVTEVDADNDVEAEAAQDGTEGAANADIAANADGTDAALSDPLAENVVVSEALDKSLLKAAGVKTATPSDMEKESVVKILDMPAFAASKVIDGVRISVAAEEGAFPEDAVLVVEKVPVAKERQAEAAVAEQRADGQNVAVSYTFDIRIEDSEGNELQPADGKTVQVSFSTAEIADGNLETNVYHITEEGGSASADSEEAVVSEAGETAEAGN